MKKIRSVAAIGLMICLCFNIYSVSSSKIEVLDTAFTLYVDDDFNETTPDWGITNFSKIQDAINASSNGDTIFVYNGTYYENIIINKSVRLLGEHNTETVIFENNIYDDIIDIFADNVILSGFKFDCYNSGFPDITIKVFSNNCNINNNTFDGNTNYDSMSGVSIEFIKTAENNYFVDNEIKRGGLSLCSSNFNIIERNRFNEGAISLSNSSDNKISKNYVKEGLISLTMSSSNIVSYNLLTHCNYGIYVSTHNKLYYSVKNRNEFLNNDFYHNERNAFIEYRGNCLWKNNFWGPSETFDYRWLLPIPRPIFGNYCIDTVPFEEIKFTFYRIDFDMRPALSPNCDFGSDT